MKRYLFIVAVIGIAGFMVYQYFLKKVDASGDSGNVSQFKPGGSGRSAGGATGSY